MSPEQSTTLRLIYPDGTHTLEETADLGAFPRRGDEVAPGWIADAIEVRDGQAGDVVEDGRPVYVDVRVVPTKDFVA